VSTQLRTTRARRHGASPSGDIARIGLPYIGDMGLYYGKQNAGKRNLSIHLNWPEAHEIVADLCRTADVIVEN
jgi:CoA:oxalate CoA-transferase